LFSIETHGNAASVTNFTMSSKKRGYAVCYCN